MAQFTYLDIEKGKTVEFEDTLILYHKEHIVSKDKNGYYLKCGCGGENNDWIFRYLGIKNKCEFCESSSKKGIFPYVETLKDLTRIVKKLWEYNPIHEGDKVKVRDIHPSPSDYGVYVADQMASLSGQYIQCNKQYFQDHDKNIKHGVYVGIFADSFYWSADTLDFNEIKRAAVDKQADESLEFEPALKNTHNLLHQSAQEGYVGAAGLMLPKRNKNLKITL